VGPRAGLDMGRKYHCHRNSLHLRIKFLEYWSAFFCSVLMSHSGSNTLDCIRLYLRVTSPSIRACSNNVHFNTHNFLYTLSLPFLLYGSETWTIKTRDARRITAAEIKCTTRTAGYTWTDYKQIHKLQRN
jgi:hypothetical protein